ALAVDRAHGRHTRREQLLDRLADLDLVGVGGNDERVDVGVEGLVRLLGHDRPDDHVAGILHDDSSSLASAAAPVLESRATVASSDAFENTSQSFRSTS